LTWELTFFSHHGKVGPLMTGGGFNLLLKINKKSYSLFCSVLCFLLFHLLAGIKKTDSHAYLFTLVPFPHQHKEYYYFLSSIMNAAGKRPISSFFS